MSRVRCRCGDLDCQACTHDSEDPLYYVEHCRKADRTGYGCTQPLGHKGRHIACCNGIETDNYEEHINNESLHIIWGDEECYE